MTNTKIVPVSNEAHESRTADGAFEQSRPPPRVDGENDHRDTTDDFIQALASSR